MKEKELFKLFLILLRVWFSLLNIWMKISVFLSLLFPLSNLCLNILNTSLRSWKNRKTGPISTLSWFSSWIKQEDWFPVCFHQERKDKWWFLLRWWIQMLLCSLLKECLQWWILSKFLSNRIILSHLLLQTCKISFNQWWVNFQRWNNLRSIKMSFSLWIRMKRKWFSDSWLKKSFSKFLMLLILVIEKL